jgi:hypothetical protein
LLAQTAGLERIPAAVATAIVSKAERNPLFAEELLRHALHDRGERRAAALPNSIRGAVAERLDQMARGPRRTITSAAATGDVQR